MGGLSIQVSQLQYLVGVFYNRQTALTCLRCLDTVRGSRHVAQLQVTLHFSTSHFYAVDSDFTPYIVIYSDLLVIGDWKLLSQVTVRPSPLLSVMQ